jgi:hypothetical protein
MQYADLYAQGKMAATAFPNVNSGIPYPPFYHLFLAIFAFLGILHPAIIFLQLFGFPIVLLVSYWVIYKLSDARIATLFLLVLACSGGFFDRVEQATPQSLDFLCFPLALYFFKKSKEIPFLATVLIPIYSHSGYGFLLFAPFVAFSLLFNYNKGFIKKAILLALPIILVTAAYLPNAIHYSLAEVNAQNLIFKDFFFHGHFEDSFPFTYIGLTIAILVIPTLSFLFKCKRKFTKAEEYLVTMSTLFFFLTVFLIPFFADRFISYSAFPLSILIALFCNTVIQRSAFHPSKPLAYIILMMLAAISWIIGIQYFLVG